MYYYHYYQYQKQKQQQLQHAAHQDLPNTWFYKDYFTQDQITTLCNYKCKGLDLSIAFRYILSPFYNRVLTFLPIWIAPNLVTLFGFLVTLSTHLLQFYHDPLMTGIAPSYVYVLLAAGLFFYQMMDNLDGKQARRTAASSPLGHLFDHGCDALNVGLAGMSLASALGLGNTLDSLTLVWSLGFLVFYMASVEEHFTGAMILREINGPNEGLLLIETLFILTAYKGSRFWTQLYTIANITLPLNKWILLLAFPLSGPTAAANLYHAYRALRTQKGCSFIQATAQLLRALAILVQFSLLIYFWPYLCPCLIKNHPHIYMWTVTQCFFYIASRLILFHLTAQQHPVFLTALAPFYIAPLIVFLYEKLGAQPPIHHPISVATLQYTLLVAMLAYYLFINIRRCYCVSKQLCAHLGIYCFSIKKRAE